MKDKYLNIFNNNFYSSTTSPFDFDESQIYSFVNADMVIFQDRINSYIFRIFKHKDKYYCMVKDLDNDKMLTTIPEILEILKPIDTGLMRI
jgi:hypothetical protein